MGQPTAQEVLEIALINRARLDPAGEAARYGISLNAGLPPGTITPDSKQPLAFNTSLETSSEGHSQSMIANNYLAYTDPITGTDPFTRMSQAGYSSGQTELEGEFLGADATAAAYNMEQAFFTNPTSGGSNFNYRSLMLDSAAKEIGVGIANNGNDYKGTEDYGARSGQFITGIAYNDTDGNAFYSIGEGRGNVVVGITGGNQTTDAAGAYSGAISAGSQTVTFSGGDLAQSVSVNATVVSGRNVLINIVGQSTIETSTSITEIGGVSKIIGLGNLSLTLAGGAGSDIIVGGLGNDILNGGVGADILTGNTGADHFAFDSSSYNDAQASTPLIDRITDYDHSAGGVINALEGDQVDVSTPLQAGLSLGQPANALVRVVDDPSGSHVSLQVDTDGTAGGNVWTTVAYLDSLHVGDTVNAVLSTSAPSGTSFSVQSNGGHFGDFNGDGLADFVFRDDSGAIATWQMNGATIEAGNFLTGVSADWHIIGEGDFNGDHLSDILWQNDNGSVIFWQMSSASTIAATPGLSPAPANSDLVGIGDFDRDGKSDLFWRDLSTGAVTVQTMAGATTTISGVGNDWKVVGVGDYNGDGIADVMFRNTSSGVNAAWLMNGTSSPTTVFYPGVPNDWHVVGTGDFNGDGVADLFWHNDNGANAVWFMNNSGSVANSAFFTGVGSDWHVVATGDINGDHRDDVIWRSDGGATAVWEMNGTATPVVVFPGGAPTDWALATHHSDFV